MITIKDVASAAGVSATTVSNVIHGYSSRVSKETADKIQSVIEELGYIPNMSARSLVSRSSHVIALINHLHEQDAADIIMDPFYMRSITQIENSMRESGYYLMLRTCRTRRDLITFLQNWNADGLFVFGAIEGDFADALLQSGKPILMIDNNLPDIGLSYVMQDDYQGGVLAATALLEHGHTRIGYAAPYGTDCVLLSSRLNGFRDTLAKAGHPFDDSLLFVSGSHSLSASFSIAQQIKQAADSGMTALACYSDQLAIILVAALKKKGMRFPEDLSVIGYGDLPQGLLLDPELTTIHYSVEDKAALAVSGMLAMLRGDQEEKTQIMLPVSITYRNSVCSR